MSEARRVVTASPENSETPLDELRSWVTPTKWFFVRNHFDVPQIDIARWHLSVEGLVERPRCLRFEELSDFPERTIFATMECAGNGRSFLRPNVAGVQWGAGAVGNAEWTGVPVREILRKAGWLQRATEVVFVGADRGSEPDRPETMAFAHSLPLEKALHEDTLLALRMNGELLEANHGFPVRLIVPGWYGVVSVKWLEQIIVTDRPFDGYFQTVKYAVDRRRSAGIQREPVQRMVVKSEIIRPRSGEVLGVGCNRLFGLAWAGEDAVASVEVSTDHGKRWDEAQLVGPRAPYAWTMWEYLWEVSTPGIYEVLSRAVAASGARQPLQRDVLLGGYEIHHVRPVVLEVREEFHTEDHLGDVDAIVFDMNAYAEENSRFPLDVDLEYSMGGGI